MKISTKMKVAFILSITLSGCSVLSSMAANYLVTNSPDGVSLSSEVVAGDSKQQAGNEHSTKMEDVHVNGSVSNETSGRKNEFREAKSVVLNEGITFLEAGILATVMLVLGVFMPQLTLTRKK